MPTETHRFPTDGPVHLHLRSGRGTVEVHRRRRDRDARRRVRPPRRRQSCACRRPTTAAQVTVEVPRTWRLGSTPRFDITVRLPTRLHRRPRHRVGEHRHPRRRSPRPTPRRPAARCRSSRSRATAARTSASGDIAARHDRRHRRRSRARRATSGWPASAAAARRGPRPGAIDIGWAGDLVSAASASGRRHRPRRRSRRGDLQVDVGRRRRSACARAPSCGSTSPPCPGAPPPSLAPEDAPDGGKEEVAHGEGADRERQHHDQPQRRRRGRGLTPAQPVAAGSTTVLRRPERRS